MELNFSRIARCPTPIRVGLFVLLLLLLWLPIALPISWMISDSNLATILTIPVLYTEFLLLVVWWGRSVYGEPNLIKVYGLRQPRKTARNVLQGLAIGLSSLFAMFIVESLCGWAIWQPQSDLPRIVLEGGIVAIAYGFAEELLFRGWLLNELERGYPAQTALWTSSIIFAALHGFRPQFPALVILGSSLVWAKRSAGRLGVAIGLHAGLIWGYYIVNVGQIVKFTGRVPDWVTGIDRNPLAGVVAIVALSAIAIAMRKAAIDRRFS